MEPSLSYTNVKIITILNKKPYKRLDLSERFNYNDNDNDNDKMIMIMIMTMMIKVPQRASERFTLCWHGTPTKTMIY